MYVSWIKRYKNLISQLSPPKFRYFEDQNRPKGDPWKWILTNSKCKNEVPNQLGLERQMKKIGSSILLSYLRCGLRSLNCQKLCRFCNFLLILAKILDCSSNLCIYIYLNGMFSFCSFRKWWVSTFLDILFFNISWTVSYSHLYEKSTIFWKSIMRSFRWIKINCFNIFRFLAEVSKNLQNSTILSNLRTITQERKMEFRQMTLYFSSTFWALTVCDTRFCIWKLPKFIFMGSYFRPFWSAK